jgi:predicted aspartyl protease
MTTKGRCFTGYCKGISNVLISIAHIESALTPSDIIEITAMWDTGASASLITPNLARKLSLIPFKKILLSTPTSKMIASNVYRANIILPNGVKIKAVNVAEGIPNNCDMLIGMDIISQGDFAVSQGKGNTLFSFRMPSMAEIDFCKHSYLID